MHTHIAQTIVTKGMLPQSCSNTVSLVTNGYLDEGVLQVIRRGGGQQGVDFELLVELVGRKSFVLDLKYELEGSVIAELVKELAVSAFNSFPYEQTSELRARIAREFFAQYDVTGIKVSELQEALILIGTKELHSIAKLEVEGKQFFGDVTTLELRREITGKKVNNIVLASDVTGKKLTNMNKKIEVKGKRDITNILIALDLLGGNDERTDN
jgi:hypothetical protein